MSVEAPDSNALSRAFNSITHHTYNLDGADPAHLEQRLSYLERALTLRGGRLTSVKRRLHRSGRHEAIVRYEVPVGTLERASTVSDKR